MTGRVLTFGLLSGLLLAGCGTATDSRQSMTMDQQFQSDLALVSRARVYFGHQSVGGNIIAGIDDLSRAAGAGPDVLELGTRPIPTGPMFLHSNIGENGRPLTKIETFANVLDHLPANAIDIALMKLCYIDFSEQTDPETLLVDYAARMAELQARHPRTLFVHVTVPLKADEGVKGFIKAFIGYGQPIRANIQRNRYNWLLRRRFGSEPLFDLALMESTRSDGSRSLFQRDGASYEQLAREYSSDGGHLNNHGRQVAARSLITSLATAMRSNSRMLARLELAHDDDSQRPMSGPTTVAELVR